MKTLSTIIIFLVAIHFQGCIPVDELDEQLWKNATLDEELEGNWKSVDPKVYPNIPSQSHYFSFAKTKQSYKLIMTDTSTWLEKNSPRLCLSAKSYTRVAERSNN